MPGYVFIFQEGTRTKDDNLNPTYGHSEECTW